MITRFKLFSSLVLLGCLGLLNGCGGGSSTANTVTASELSGRATQSPVAGSTIFADRVVGGVSNFMQDAGETATTTDASGNYKLATPNYDYILVSKGGVIDPVTKQKQILMLAPKGSANITPLTTLVTLDTTGKLAKKLQDLQGGISFDSDVYTKSSPAVLMLIKSVEISVQSLTDTFLQKSGGTLSDDQIFSIQARVMQEIAKTFTSSTKNLAVPANLNSELIAAFKIAIPAVTKPSLNYSNIELNQLEVANIATAIVPKAVDAAANKFTSLGSAYTTALGVNADTAESSMVSFAATFNAAQSATITALLAPAFSIAASSTPVGFSPETFPVVTSPASTITGSTGTPGSF